MYGLITLIVRMNALRKHSSKEPTAITPLEGMKKVVLFLDSNELSSLRDTNRAKAFFASRGIALEAYEMGIDRSDVNLWGIFKKGRNLAVARGDEDLFISLLKNDPFTVEYAARTSRAPFKIGRAQLRGGVYDVVFSNPEGSEFTQSEVLDAVLDFLVKVK